MLTACTVLLDADGGVEFRVPRPPTLPKWSLFVTLANDEEAQIVALLIGDLLYRDDLRARFPNSVTCADTASDAELAISAYRQGGRTALEHLEGEFALILWDGTTRRLLALRDPLGCWPLFWLAQGSTLAVSTSLEALALQSGRSFDQGFLAEFLMWPNPHTELPCEQTPFTGPRRVLAGSMVEWAPGRPVRQQRYWEWPARIGRTPGITRVAAGATVARVFRQAVQERLRRGPAAAHLSGGMDSSAVACIAHDLQAEAGGPPLATLSLIYPHSSLVGERQYIDLVLQQREGVVPRFVDGETVPDYEWFRSGLPYHEEPYAGLPGIGAEQPLLEAARDLGAATVLTGFGSDELFASSPLSIADLLQQRRWLAAWKEARRWARAENRGTWTFLRRYGMEQAWPQWSGDKGSWPNLGWFSVPPWVNREFAKKEGMAERGRHHARRLSGTPISEAVQENSLATGSGDWARWHLAAPLGLRLSHPFQDPRLMCFALGLPTEILSVPGERKPALQTALRGILPEAIGIRRDKRGFDDIYGLGLVRNLEYLEGMVRKSALRELGVVDGETLIAAMHDAALGVGDIRSRERMDKTLALIAWFDTVVRQQPPTEPVVVHCLNRKLSFRGRVREQRAGSRCLAGE